MRARWVASPNWSERCSGVVDLVVLHYTALPFEETIDMFKDPESGVSAHFVLDRDGSLVQMVKTWHKAWHAGRSEFDGRPDVNDYSIGVELVNWGHLKRKQGRFYVWKDGWSRSYEGKEPVCAQGEYFEPYTEEQYERLTGLVSELRTEYPEITRDRVKGHSAVCVPQGRKKDPGPAFCWDRVLEGVFANRA